MKTALRTAGWMIAACATALLVMRFGCAGKPQAVASRSGLGDWPGRGATLPSHGGGAPGYANGDSPGSTHHESIGISNDSAVVVGQLEKELIREVIHKNRAQLQFCYESQLTRAPKLAGKVAIAFTIGPAGNVLQTHIAESTVNNPELERCIAARFKSWLFPKPSGGGIVQATYPVVFKLA